MKNILIFSILFSFAYAAVKRDAGRIHYDNYKVLRITPKNEKSLQILFAWETNAEPGLNFWTDVGGIDHAVDLMVSPDQYNSITTILNENNIPYYVMIEDVEPLIKKELETNAKRNKVGALTFRQYYRLSEIYSFIDSLGNQYPSIAKVSSIGKSFENRDLKLLKIGKDSAVKKTAIWLDGAIHPREWISPTAVLYIISQLVNNYGKDAIITKLVDNIDFYFLPVINPDGYEYTWTKDRLWRKTRSTSGSTNEGTWWCPWCANTCVGTDANRNFDFHWREQGTSADPCQDTYGGSKAFSEVETRAVANAILSKKDQIKVYLSFHSYSQMWLVPYGHTQVRPENYQEMITVAQQCVRALSSAYGTQYRIGTPGELLYRVSGGSHDWAKGVAKIKYSYTLELRDTGRFGFTLPPELIIPTSQETWLAFKLLATKLADNQL